MSKPTARTLSPRELAETIGVSESSVKRWVDAGHVASGRTAGGHRRIAVTEALRFIRTQGHPVLRPELLGLQGDLPSDDALDDEAFYGLLLEGRSEEVFAALTAGFLAGQTLAALFDGPVRRALHRLGALWHEHDDGIFREHRATTLLVSTVAQLRRLLPPAPAEAPVALGGAPEGDPYLLPSLMAAAVAAEVGYDVMDLGPHTPAKTFAEALRDARPRWVWLAVKAPLTSAQRDELLAQVLPWSTTNGAQVAVGGPAQDPADWPDDVHVVSSMEAWQQRLQQTLAHPA